MYNIIYLSGPAETLMTENKDLLRIYVYLQTVLKYLYSNKKKNPVE